MQGLVSDFASLCRWEKSSPTFAAAIMIVLSSYGGAGDDSVSVKGDLVAFLGGVAMAFYLSGTMPNEILQNEATASNTTHF